MFAFRLKASKPIEKWVWVYVCVSVCINCIAPFQIYFESYILYMFDTIEMRMWNFEFNAVVINPNAYYQKNAIQRIYIATL